MCKDAPRHKTFTDVIGDPAALQCLAGKVFHELEASQDSNYVVGHPSGGHTLIDGTFDLPLILMRAIQNYVQGQR